MTTRRNLMAQTATIVGLGPLVEAMAAGTFPLPSGIHRLRGEAWVNGIPARVEQAVLPGDTVRTGPRSELVYAMGNSAYLMREDSEMSFAADGAVGVLRIITGKVLAVFGPGAKRIETRTATVGIRGTACYIESGESQVYFCLCYGTADIRPLADPSQAMTMTTLYHDKPLNIGADATRPLLQSAPVQNHRDAELSLLEATVGRVPPFQARQEKNSY